MAAFFGRTLVETRGVFRYASEILRQAGILVVGSLLIICVMEFIVGTMCGTVAVYITRAYGATAYSGVITTECGGRDMAAYMFGYILSAKVGCGLVAELGSMRINNEFDAMESMGLNPLRYTVATRLMAGWIALPFIYITGLAFNHLGNFVVVVVQVGEASQGGWEFVHWSFTRAQDILFTSIKGMVIGTVVLLVSMYYGYTARGGPVGVGTATAKSMVVNLLLVHIIGMATTVVFWGADAHLPVGG